MPAARFLSHLTLWRFMVPMRGKTVDTVDLTFDADDAVGKPLRDGALLSLRGAEEGRIFQRGSLYVANREKQRRAFRYREDARERTIRCSGKSQNTACVGRV